MDYENEVTIVLSSKSQNEAFARVAVAAFTSQLDPTVDELTDVKTAVSEAVTNAIIHGYENSSGKITIDCKIKDSTVFVEVRDEGTGIENIAEARKPLYTSKPDSERSGMGFTVMEAFMDSISVESQKDKGTKVCMQKKIIRE